MACIQRNSPLVVCRHGSIVNILTQAMHSSYNNRIENKAFKRAVFVLLLIKFDRVGSIPGNEEGVLWFVSFCKKKLACRPWESEGLWNYLSPSLCWISVSFSLSFILSVSCSFSCFPLNSLVFCFCLYLYFPLSLSLSLPFSLLLLSSLSFSFSFSLTLPLCWMLLLSVEFSFS